MKELTLEEFKLKYGEEIAFDKEGIANLGYGYYAKLEGEKVKIYEKEEGWLEKKILLPVSSRFIALPIPIILTWKYFWHIHFDPHEVSFYSKTFKDVLPWYS